MLLEYPPTRVGRRIGGWETPTDDLATVVDVDGLALLARDEVAAEDEAIWQRAELR